jgi:hypothetical protein
MQLKIRKMHNLLMPVSLLLLCMLALTSCHKNSPPVNDPPKENLPPAIILKLDNDSIKAGIALNIEVTAAGKSILKHLVIEDAISGSGTPTTILDSALNNINIGCIVPFKSNNRGSRFIKATVTDLNGLSTTASRSLTVY